MICLECFETNIDANFVSNLTIYVFCVQEKATKHQKHVMLFWESKLIHKLRGKSKSKSINSQVKQAECNAQFLTRFEPS